MRPERAVAALLLAALAGRRARRQSARALPRALDARLHRRREPRRPRTGSTPERDLHPRAAHRRSRHRRARGRDRESGHLGRRRRHRACTWPLPRFRSVAIATWACRTARAHSSSNAARRASSSTAGNSRTRRRSSAKVRASASRATCRPIPSAFPAPGWTLRLEGERERAMGAHRGAGGRRGHGAGELLLLRARRDERRDLRAPGRPLRQSSERRRRCRHRDSRLRRRDRVRGKPARRDGRDGRAVRYVQPGSGSATMQLAQTLERAPRPSARTSPTRASGAPRHAACRSAAADLPATRGLPRHASSARWAKSSLAPGRTTMSRSARASPDSRSRKCARSSARCRAGARSSRRVVPR